MQRILELSKETDLIIAPGTICWRKDNNKVGHPFKFFRNSVYFFHKGTREKYKKKHPAISDEDYSQHGIQNKHKFHAGTKDSPIIKINDLTIGVEICLDNNYSVVEKNKKDNEIDIHLVLANRLKKLKLPSYQGPLFIKIDFRPCYTKSPDLYPTEIGTLVPTFTTTSTKAKLEYATCVSEYNDLFCYKFTDPSTALAFRNTMLPPSCQLSKQQYIKHIQTSVKDCGLEELQPSTIDSLMQKIISSIHHAQEIEVDFPHHISTLKSAGLLNDENAITLFTPATYATSYTSALVEMKQAGLLTPNMNELLNKNKKNALHLKNLIIMLHKEGYLTDDVKCFFTNSIRTFSVFKKDLICEAYVIFYELIKLKLFKIEYLFQIFSNLHVNHRVSNTLKANIKLANDDDKTSDIVNTSLSSPRRRSSVRENLLIM